MTFVQRKLESWIGCTFDMFCRLTRSTKTSWQQLTKKELRKM